MSKIFHTQGDDYWVLGNERQELGALKGQLKTKQMVAQ